MSYYEKVNGTISAGKTARSNDIHLIQSHIQSAMKSMIGDMFGTGAVLGKDENALSLYSTSQHIDQKSEATSTSMGWLPFLDVYYKQPIIITKSSIETIKIKYQNLSNVSATAYGEIRDNDFNLIQETNVSLEPGEAGDVKEAEFNFYLNHLQVGLYYFVLRPISISATDLTINGDETPYDTIDETMFLVGYDGDGTYGGELQASYDGNTYLDSNILLEDIQYDEDGDIITSVPDLIFEQIYSSGTTYLINKGSAIILGEKVYPLDTHVTIDPPSSDGDRTDLVTLTTDGRLNVIKGSIYNTTKDSVEDYYPKDDTGLKIAYITSYQVGGSKWICPNCGNTNYKTNICPKCEAAMPSGSNKIPLLEQNDENGKTRTRDILERIRRLEKKVSYQEQNNSPVRIKYNCVVDPILSNNGVDEDAATRGEGTYNVNSETSNGETSITSSIGVNYAWSIIKDNYTYTNALGSSTNARITLYDCATTKTQVAYDTSKLSDGELLICAKAIELGDGENEAQVVGNGTPLSGLKMEIQIKKGGTLKKTYSVTTNSEGMIRLSVWDAKLSKGKYTIYLIYENVQVAATMQVYDSTSVKEEITPEINTSGEITTENSSTNTKEVFLLEPHHSYITITQNEAGSVTKTLTDGVIPGNDSFGTTNMDVDIDNGEVRVAKISNKGEEYTTNTLLKDSSTFTKEQKQYTINKKNSSKYPLLHFTLERDTTIKSITPYIDGFQNIKEFGILIFKNDNVFSELENSRQTYIKNISKTDVTYPTQYDSGYKSLEDLVKQSSNWKVLKEQVEFEVNKDFDAGTYTLMIYAKEEDSSQEGVIKLTEYQTLEKASKYGVAATATGTTNLSQIYMDTSDLSDWSWDVAITQKTYTYYDKGELISKAYNTGATIRAINVTKNLIIPEGCAAELWVSNNGRNFHQMKTNSIKFSDEGNVFQWKLVFYATVSASPKLKFNPTRQFAISFTLATSANYVEYEDYNQCYETPLINANVVTRTFTNSVAKDTFSTWEFARIYMEDEDLQSKIDICISYAYDNYSTHVSTTKAGWGKDIFFNTIFSDLSLDDFTQDSVDYSNYTGDVEYDEHNYRFNLVTEDTMHYTGGKALAAPDSQSSSTYQYEAGSSTNIANKFQIKYIDKAYSYRNNDGDSTQQYAGMHLTNGPYYEAKYLGGDSISGTTTTTNPGYTQEDVILGVTFPTGLTIDENRSSLTIGIFAGKNSSTTDNYYDPNTFDIVVSTNPNGEVDANDPSTGKFFPITKKLDANITSDSNEDKISSSTISTSLSYNEVTISLLEDLKSWESNGIYYIGIRARDPTTAMSANDSIGIGRITHTSYNIRPLLPYCYKGIWDRFTWENITSNENCKAYAICTLGRKDAYMYSNQKIFYPISNDDDTREKEVRTITASGLDDDFNLGQIGVWKNINSSYRKITKDSAEGDAYTGPGTIIREGSTITTTLNNMDSTFVTQDSAGQILFDLPADVTGNLFKIETDIPFTIYDLIAVQYKMFCEYIPISEISYDMSRLLVVDEDTKETKNMYNNSNIRDDGVNYYITDGSFSKGEIILDLYETTDTDNAQPIESLVLPSWGRVATQSSVSDKTINAWFKKHTNSTQIKCMILRRANPRKLDQVPHIRLIIDNILLFNADQQLALGPQMQMRIYPNVASDFSNNTKIRKYGAIYRIK